MTSISTDPTLLTPDSPDAAPIHPDPADATADLAAPVSADVDGADAPPPPPPSPAARALARRRIKADQRGVMIGSTLMALVGWLGLYLMLFPLNVAPRVLYRWLFFILFYIAVTGTVLPFIWYLNNRFSGGRPVLGGTILRQGMWCGLFFITIAWLQMIRALNGALAFFLALAFIVIETYLRYRERQNA
jgi:hypothetical protein